MSDARVRVLIVEDEAFVAMLIEDMLTELGFDIAGVASRVSAALPLVSTLNFDLAILDVNLAGEVSFPVADAIAGKGVPYMFATGYGRKAIIAAHAHRPVISKPFSIDELRYAIRLSLADGPATQQS
jgi:CheY-like chemotaxis protein